MNIYDEAWWINFIGSIPEDFFVKVKDEKVCLYYRGKNYETFVHPSEAGQLLERGACLIFFASVESNSTQTPLKVQQSIRSTVLEVRQKTWQEYLGQLPEGFFIEVRDFDLKICYNGFGYKEVIECGGKRPPESRKHAFLGLHTIRCDKPEELGTLKAEVVSFVRGCVERAQKQVSALSK